MSFLRIPEQAHDFNWFGEAGLYERASFELIDSSSDVKSQSVYVTPGVCSFNKKSVEVMTSKVIRVNDELHYSN